MSVINTMLKELDKRQQSHTLDNMQVEPVQYQVSIYSKTPWVLLIIVSFLLLLGVGYGWSNIIKNVVNQQVKLKQVLTSLVLTDPVEEESHNLVDISTQVVDIPAPPVSNVQLVIEMTPIENKLAKLVSEQDVIQGEVSPLPVVHEAAYKKNRDNNTSSMTVTEVRLSAKQVADKKYQFGTQAEDRGKQREAIEYYHEALKLSPAYHQARQRLAALFYGQGDLVQTRDTLQQGITLFPQELDYRMLLARVLQSAGEYDQALATLDGIPDGGTLSKPKWIQESSIAQKLKRYTLAEESYRKLLQTETTQSRWWMGLAYALDAQKKYEAAIVGYRQALLYKEVPKQGLSGQAVDYIEARLVQLGESL